MAEAQAIAGQVATAIGLGEKIASPIYSAFAPQWIAVKVVFFVVSTGLTLFNTVTDWRVVLNYQEVGFNNPILPLDVPWLHAWMFFAIVGTILAVLSISQDSLGLLYSIYKSCKRCECCKKLCRTGHYEMVNSDSAVNSKVTDRDADAQEHEIGGNVEYSNLSLTENAGEDPDKSEKDKDEIDDPCKPCYHCGCNTATRKETIGAISLWFQDVPMLTIAILYAYSQTTCKTPEARNIAPVLRDIGISATAATVSALWRLILSFVNLYSSVGVRMKCNHKIKKCLPKEGAAAYPLNTRVQYCIFPFFFGLIMQFQAIAMAATVTGVLWLQLAVVNPGVDNSLGIYRFVVDGPDVRLFNVSNIIMTTNGSFVHSESIDSISDGMLFEIFCLSEFEYRKEKSNIFFNTIGLKVVSEDGRFCYSESYMDSDCGFYYTFRNFVLYYGSLDPDTGQVVRFDNECTAIKDKFFYEAGPFVDISINVSRHVDFPANTGPLVVFYPDPLNLYVRVSSILGASDGSLRVVHTFQDFETSANVTCAVEFRYDSSLGQIVFNYRDVYGLESLGLTCFTCGSGTNCRQFHQNLAYAYLTEDSRAVVYTQCSDIPREKLVPYYKPYNVVKCPCFN